MTMTDDKLTGLIATQFGKGSLRVSLEQVERRGRQRRRHGRVTIAVAALTGLAGLAAIAAYGVDQRGQHDDLAAGLHRSCQKAYRAEVGKTLRADQLPPALGTPLLELRRDGTHFWLYTSPAGRLRAMTFDCFRAADGTVSGRISYATAQPQSLDKPIVAYRAHLNDGTVAVVARLRDPRALLRVTPASAEVNVSQTEGVAVVWGPAAVLATAKLTAGDATVDLARDQLVMTATFQRAEFDAYCDRELAKQPSLAGAQRAVTAKHADAWVFAVHLGPQGFGYCSWHNMPDDPANGVSYHGPAMQVAHTDKAEVGMILASTERDGSHSWITGPTPPGVERVEVQGDDGAINEAQLHGGIFVTYLPGSPKFTRITMITATTVYTIADNGLTQQPR